MTSVRATTGMGGQAPGLKLTHRQMVSAAWGSPAGQRLSGDKDRAQKQVWEVGLVRRPTHGEAPTLER